jgi:hypothetical protein
MFQIGKVGRSQPTYRDQSVARVNLPARGGLPVRTFLAIAILSILMLLGCSTAREESAATATVDPTIAAIAQSFIQPLPGTWETVDQCVKNVTEIALGDYRKTRVEMGLDVSSPYGTATLWRACADEMINQRKRASLEIHRDALSVMERLKFTRVEADVARLQSEVDRLTSQQPVLGLPSGGFTWTP